jgi:glycosyltransferase involved in cell wall biosynthesis
MSAREANESARPIVFLGGIFTPRQIDLIERESKGVIQNAADGLQKKLIEGLSETYPGSISILNLPFIGSYPQLSRLAFFPATNEFVHAKLLGQSFVNIRMLKSFSRLVSSFLGLLRAAPSRRCAVIVYSAHLPFLVAAIMYRYLFRGSRICLVLPDFPEFMSDGGRLYRIAKSIETWIFYKLVRHIDRFVLLTRFMAERLNLQSEQFTVVEGIADALPGNNYDDSDISITDRRVFLYTGTLAARYGVMDLVEAFQLVKHPRAELWICGEGDSRERIVDAAKQDLRIRFLGQVSRDAARKLQRDATVLVNPRLPVGEFTKYSFPSKTMEYMASGRPVLMHHLTGVPEEYLPHFVRPSSVSVEGLAMAMERLAAQDSNELRSMGTAAREFVLKQKNAIVQCQKIVELIASLP